MKRSIIVLVSIALLFGLFGCAKGENVPQKEYESLYYDDLLIRYPKDEGYQSELVNDDWFSLYNAEKGDEIAIRRNEKLAEFDSDAFMKQQFSEEQLKEENGILYAERDDALYRILDSDYYIYIIYRLPLKEDVDESVKAEAFEIFSGIAVDETVTVAKPEEKYETFTFKDLKISVPEKQYMKEADLGSDYALVSFDTALFLSVNVNAVQDFIDAGFADMNAVIAEVFAGREIRQTENGRSYAVFDAATDATQENTHSFYYMPMYNADDFYDFIVFVQKDRVAELEPVVLKILEDLSLEQ